MLAAEIMDLPIIVIEVIDAYAFAGRGMNKFPGAEVKAAV